MQAIQASLIDAGEGHNAQAASAGNGTTPNVQPAGGLDPKVRSTFPARGLALLSCFMRYPSSTLFSYIPASLPQLLMGFFAALVVLQDSRL